MAEITLRTAEPRDASKLAGIHLRARRTSMPYLPVIHAEEETLRWMAECVVPAMEVWVAEAGAEVAGYIALHGDLVDQLYVAPEWQQRRIGSALLERAKHLRPAGLSLYCFVSNAPARAFYEARGFAPLLFADGERNEEGLPDVLYRWVAPR